MRLAYELGKAHGENARAAEAENKVAPAQKKEKVNMKITAMLRRIRIALFA